ncbi:MAG TPA: hypothetical protein VMH30_03055 [Verrucomicrobiae bacterium]|nr:hypothetical protein [Verrucomicrobiae bacterium]
MTFIGLPPDFKGEGKSCIYDRHFVNEQFEQIREQIHEIRNFISPLDLKLEALGLQIEKSRILFESKAIQIESKIAENSSLIALHSEQIRQILMFLKMPQVIESKPPAPVHEDKQNPGEIPPLPPSN